MDELKRILAVLCGMSLMKNALCILLPQGGIKRFAQYGFSIVQMSVFTDIVMRMLQLLQGVLP